MYIRKLIFLITVIIASTVLYAEDFHASSEIDIEKVVVYKDFKGEWIENNDSDKLEHFINTYSSGFEDIVALNGNDYRKKRKVFVPFSEVYLEYLKSRDSVSTNSSVYNFIWPIEKFDRITSTFGRRWSMFHEGIDIPAGKGIPILAVSNGRVITAKFIENLGNTICLEHRDNIVTRYCHASEVLVKEGEIIKKGQVIGYVGSTGNSTGNHLHFEVRYGDFPLNPLDFLPFNPNVKKAQYIKKLD